MLLSYYRFQTVLSKKVFTQIKLNSRAKTKQSKEIISVEDVFVTLMLYSCAAKHTEDG